MSNADRLAFEAKFSAMPHEFRMERWGERAAWAGNYKSYITQCAWDGYREGRAATVPEITLDPADLLIDSFPRTPAGGMHVGMPVGVYLKHKPSGMAVIVDNHRSQHRNRDEAYRQLAFLLHFAGIAAQAAGKEGE